MRRLRFNGRIGGAARQGDGAWRLMNLLWSVAVTGAVNHMIHLVGLRSRGPQKALCAAVLLAFSTAALAHGGLSMDKDVCKLRLGPYYMHFTGYQVHAGRPNTEFCEDIPATGRTIIVLDALDQPLREIPVTVRIVTDTGEGSASESGTARHTVVELPAKMYPSGSVSLEHTFEQPGRFVGVVTAGDNGEFVSEFPFSVGIDKRPYGFYGLLVLIVMAGFGLYAYSGRRHAKAALLATRG